MKLLDSVIQRLRRATGGASPDPVTAPARETPPSETEYYEDLFVRNPDWNKTTPNVDESSRWEVIRAFLDRHFEAGESKQILDAGCGRGWLTNLLSGYGTAMGIEPVAPVVAHARRLFPALSFEATTPQQLPGIARFDAIVSSEVLEHVIDKPAFLARLHALLRPGGLLIVTTPRGELYEEWTTKFGRPAQPIEEWISTDALVALLRQVGFDVLESRTAFEIGIYQIHAARRR
jgi:2-polyprenyl-3-methyl-5-hydroxy-6-metoxy-1,4-benzoquinol methylase